MIVSQCCGAPLIAMFEEPACTQCKENCETWDDEDDTRDDGDQERDQERDQDADSE